MPKNTKATSILEFLQTPEFLDIPYLVKLNKNKGDDTVEIDKPMFIHSYECCMRPDLRQPLVVSITFGSEKPNKERIQKNIKVTQDGDVYTSETEFAELPSEISDILSRASFFEAFDTVARSIRPELPEVGGVLKFLCNRVLDRKYKGQESHYLNHAMDVKPKRNIRKTAPKATPPKSQKNIEAMPTEMTEGGNI